MSEIQPLHCQICPFDAGETILGCAPNQQQLSELPQPLAGQVGYCAMQRLQYERTDWLTQMPNFRTFQANIAEVLEKEGPQSVLVAFVDGDRMKEVNDTHGHVVGDEVIAGLGNRLNDGVAEGIAEMLVNTVRTQPDRRQHAEKSVSAQERRQGERRKHSHLDLVTRRSGDEFLIALFGLTMEESLSAIERIHGAINRQFAVETTGGTLDVSASVHFGYLQSATTLEEVMEAIDYTDECLNEMKSLVREQNPRQ